MTEALRLVKSYGWSGIAVWDSKGDREGYIAAVFGYRVMTPERPSWHPFPTVEEAVADLVRRLREEKSPT